jgi:hypothetical protein
MWNLIRHQGKIDILKGSYYANPIEDAPSVSSAQREAYPEYYGENVCTCS